MSGVFLLAAALTFENPVIRTNWPDPTFWQDGTGVWGQPPREVVVFDGCG